MYVRCLQHEANVANSTATSPMAHSIRCQEDDQKVNWEAEEVIRRGEIDRNLTTQSLASWNFSESHTTRNTFPEILWGFDYHNRALEHETTTVTATRTCQKNWFLMGRIKAQRVRFQTMYISQPSSAKQQRETSKICLVCGHKPR